LVTQLSTEDHIRVSQLSNEEKKKRRLERNAASARFCRQRKKLYIESLRGQLPGLRHKIKALETALPEMVVEAIRQSTPVPVVDTSRDSDGDSVGDQSDDGSERTATHHVSHKRKNSDDSCVSTQSAASSTLFVTAPVKQMKLEASIGSPQQQQNALALIAALQQKQAGMERKDSLQSLFAGRVGGGNATTDDRASIKNNTFCSPLVSLNALPQGMNSAITSISPLLQCALPRDFALPPSLAEKCANTKIPQSQGPSNTSAGSVQLQAFESKDNSA